MRENRANKSLNLENRLFIRLFAQITRKELFYWDIAHEEINKEE